MDSSGFLMLKLEPWGLNEQQKVRLDKLADAVHEKKLDNYCFHMDDSPAEDSGYIVDS